VYVRKWLSISV